MFVLNNFARTEKVFLGREGLAKTYSFAFNTSEVGFSEAQNPTETLVQAKSNRG